MSTGVERFKEGDSFDCFQQQQCIAEGNGSVYTKFEGNPVIPASLLPEGFSAADFRDPKLFRHEGRYYALVSSRYKDGLGKLLLVCSDDLHRWRFLTVAAGNDGKCGDMWEYPD